MKTMWSALVVVGMGCSGGSGGKSDAGGMSVLCMVAFSGAVTETDGCVGSLGNDGNFEALSFAQGTPSSAVFSMSPLQVAVNGTFSARSYALGDLNAAATNFGATAAYTYMGKNSGAWACGLSGTAACTSFSLTLTSVDPEPSNGNVLNFGGTTPSQSMGKNTHGTMDVSIPGIEIVTNGNSMPTANLVAHVTF